MLKLLFLALLALANGQKVFYVEENVSVGTFVGQIASPGPYLIVPLQDTINPEDDFVINSANGEIRTRRILDRETKDKYLFSAISQNGESIQVTIQVQDVNDNAPSFAKANVEIDIPENIPSGTLRKLPAATDPDDQHAVQKYQIVQGNNEGIFDVKYDKESLDLVVKGSLDREKNDQYSMVIVAYDSGQPPKSASMTLTVFVQDLNDSPPVFTEQRYFTTVSESLPIGSSVLTVSADDADIGKNAKITYSINRRQSDKDELFKIDPVNGLLTVNNLLNYERQPVHEIVVVAKDGGDVAQETSAFITVRLTSGTSSSAPALPTVSKTSAPKLKLKYLEGGEKVSEFVNVGQPFAMIEGINGLVLDSQDRLNIVQGQDSFMIVKDQGLFKLASRRKLDYESQAAHEIAIQVVKASSGQVFNEVLAIDVTDGNEHEPEFEQQTYSISLSESLNIGSSILTAKATDLDHGHSGQISYSFRYGDSSSSTFSDWFSIDEETGVITTQSKLDCELESNPKVIIVASDHGQPTKTATATFSASISDVNDHSPVFSQAFYDLQLSEDVAKGQCILTLSATDEDCGENAQVFYSLREHSNFFQVNQESGQVCVIQKLDYEKQKSHNLLVEAKDKGGLSSTSLINVVIKDVNDNPPEFLPSVYMVKINRNTGLNLPILSIRATDKDADMKGTLNYVIASGNDDNTFTLGADSGVVYLTRRPVANAYRLKITATDSDGQASVNEANVIVQVQDQDIPFTKYQHEFNVPEDISPYSEIGFIVPSINDAKFKYTLLDQSVHGYFSLDSRTGAIRSEARLDHETHPQVILNVQAEADNGQFYFVQAIINISDVNDNAPEFAFPQMSTNVAEDYPRSGVIVTSLATDADEGTNGKIRYNILPGLDSSLFNVDPLSGEIRLAQRLDFEVKNHHQIIVEAEDQGLPVLKSTMKLDILVQDVNDNTPVFDKTSYSVALSETHLPGTPLITIHASDKDSGKNGRISYSITPNAFVDILPNSGVLVLKAPIHKETNPTLDLTVVASDNGLPSRKSSVKVKVLVSDKNDYTPKFQRPKYTFNTLENSPRGTSVGSVIAMDDDEGLNGQIEYRFRAPSSKFRIESSSGEIQTIEQLDREEIDQYELLVEALDQGSPRRSSQTLVKIIVDDVNDEAPYIEVPANRMIYVPKTGSSSSIGTIIASDKDEKEVLSYQITSNTAGIIIDKWTGELKVRSRDVITEASNMTITVQISDSARPIPNTIEEDIAIFFVDEAANELLSIIPFTIHVDKTAFVGSIVGHLRALVNSKKDKFIYEFKNKDIPFYINSGSGDIYLISESLNSSSKSTFETDAFIKSMTGQTPPLHAKVIFEVDEMSSNSNRPKFTQDPIQIKVKENVRVGQSVHKLQTLNNQQGDNLMFAMLDQIPNEAFAIDAKSGNIRLAKQLDYERDKSFILTVRVTEFKSQLSTFVTVIVTVMDVNDNQPLVLSSDVIKLSSSVRLNAPFGKIVAIDKDQGDNAKLTYSILSGNEDQVFDIDADNGDLSLIKPAIKDYYLRVRVQDHGLDPLFIDQELQIMTMGHDYGQPKFVQSPIEVQVEENSPVGTTISKLKILNGEGLPLNYQLLVENEKFGLDPSSGQLRTQAELDREEQESYSLVVSVADQRFPQFSDTAVVHVNVEDLNDNDPVFGASCRDLNVPENSKEGYIHTLIAYDQDKGDNGRLTYKLSNEQQSLFKLDPLTGRLSSLPLDREKQSLYQLHVIAQDQGTAQVRSASCLITVNVLDENDNEPSFTQSIYSASVKEDVPIGFEVFRVQATDPDEGDNAVISYSMDNVTHSAFTIDKDTGSVVTTALLDRETLDSYTFNVLAVDGGKGVVKSSRAVVKIIITDANDHTPQFDEFPFRVNMTATPGVGVPLLRLSATDPDLGAHSQLTFNLVRPEQRALFELSASEGVLSVINGDISWEPGTIQRLEVTVSDAGRPPKSSTGLVEVFIEGGPAITLTFQQDTYHTELIENTASGEDVMKVHAVRSDGRRQRVIYTFLRGNEDGAFDINSNNGLIRVRDSEALDYEKKKQFVLVIQGQGLGLENDLTAYTTVIIAIKNVNDNMPRFVQNTYSARVLEGLKKSSIVTTVTAFDMDYEQGNEEITYEIIGGNVDNAFYMTTAQPGVILTNAVLDREVRDTYELTVAATDNGKPASLTGSCKVFINILDANDSPLQFPNFPPFKIARTLTPGSLISTIRANDIDLQSRVAYSIQEPYADKVAISTYTGQMYLTVPPDQWKENQINVIIEAFDGIYRTDHQVNIFFDENSKGCQPQFTKALYRFPLSINATYPVQVGDVKTSDTCFGDDINFSLVESTTKQSFASIVSSNGTLVINQPMPSNTSKFLVQVEDKRSKLSSTAVVVINTKASADQPLEFQMSSDTFELTDDESLLGIKLKNMPEEPVVFNVSDNPFVLIDPVTGKLFKKPHVPLDILSANVKVTAKKIGDPDDEAIEKTLRFFLPSQRKQGQTVQVQDKTIQLPLTSTPLRTKVDLCTSATTPSTLQVLSGNDDNLFNLDTSKQVLVLVKSQTEPLSSKLIIRTGDLNICVVQVNFIKADQDKNDNLIKLFPIETFVTTVEENSPQGTPIMTLPLLSNHPSDLTFSITNPDFSIDSKTGTISTKSLIDYESQTSYKLAVQASSQRQVYSCQVEILVQGQDEYPPLFSQDVFVFNVPSKVAPGFILGTLRASDKDQGADGYVTYSISPLNTYFDIDHRSGALTVRRPLDTGVIQSKNEVQLRKRRSLAEVQFNVIAKSAQPDSLSSTTKVILYVNQDLLPIAASTENTSSNASVVVGVLIGVILALVALSFAVLWCWKKAKEDKKQAANKIALLPSQSSQERVGNLNQSFSPDQSLEMVGSHHRYPPQYSEIMSDYGGTTTVTSAGGTSTSKPIPRSELSEKSHRSTSSGRGSVEDGDEDADVEIRMINEGNWTSVTSPVSASVSGSQHHYEVGDDRLSQTSVQNTEEYLARLGIDIRKPPNVKLPEDPYSTGNGGGGSIYNRIADDAMSEHNSTISAAKPHSLLYGSTGRQLSMTGSLSSVIHSEEEIAGSYNWDYLLDWCPQYQNLAHVFKEISKLKDDDDGDASTNQPMMTVVGPGRLHSQQYFGLRNQMTGGNRLVPVRTSQSPIHQDMLSQSALSPNFHPSLSPLATKSPSVSPMSVPLKSGPPRIGRGPLQ